MNAALVFHFAPSSFLPFDDACRAVRRKSDRSGLPIWRCLKAVQFTRHPRLQRLAVVSWGSHKPGHRDLPVVQHQRRRNGRTAVCLLDGTVRVYGGGVVDWCILKTGTMACGFNAQMLCHRNEN